MTGNQTKTAEDQMLLDFLDAQRRSVLAIVDGLDEEAWHRSVVPSGWTPVGLVEHLSGAEWHWFQGVVAGSEPEPSSHEDEDAVPYDPMAAFATEQPSWEIVQEYREICARSDEVLAATPLSARLKGLHGPADTEQPPDVRWVVLHMIEETARHAGHLDIARELLDGKTRLGER